MNRVWHTYLNGEDTQPVHITLSAIIKTKLPRSCATAHSSPSICHRPPTTMSTPSSAIFVVAQPHTSKMIVQSSTDGQADDAGELFFDKSTDAKTNRQYGRQSDSHRSSGAKKRTKYRDQNVANILMNQIQRIR
jgi:hypothetical protein